MKFVPIQLIILLSITTVAAQEPEQIGRRAPEWKDLAGTDGKQHSLNDLQDYEAVVVCFTCNTCPYSVDYEDRLMALQRKYPVSHPVVRVVAINSNGVAADSLGKMKLRATGKKFNFDYLRDETQDVARAYDAIYTPEFYVLNRQRNIIYRGAMDDSTKPEGVTRNFVELAIQAALDRKLPTVTSTGARGCAIRFSRKRR